MPQSTTTTTQGSSSAPSSTMGNTSGEAPIMEQARDVASQVKSEATELVATRVSRRQQQSAMELTSIANVLREKGEEMEHSLFSPLMGKAAEQVDRASGFVKDATLTDVVRSTESLARREPLLFLGGAFTLGLICARFLRSSGHHDQANDTGATTGGRGLA